MAGVNNRHRTILLKLKQMGLNSNPTVLEIGCGIGTLSGFIANQIKYGSITGVDISPDSIAFAQKKYSAKTNMEFVVSDMTNFIHQKKYDIILFPDVLEHIPLEAHQNIFDTISKLAHENSVIAINLPNPKCLRWFHQNDPEKLQIIDLDIETDYLVNMLKPLGYYLQSKETYALYFDQSDYEWFVFKKEFEYKTLKRKSKIATIINGVFLRLYLLLN
jgi:2-polyprenyl-3-methyl-5-hydroxy-6-metoxy-1,4-benzoquinol methylase